MRGARSISSAAKLPQQVDAKNKNTQDRGVRAKHRDHAKAVHRGAKEMEKRLIRGTISRSITLERSVFGGRLPKLSSAIRSAGGSAFASDRTSANVAVGSRLLSIAVTVYNDTNYRFVR